MQQHGSQYFARRHPPPSPTLGVKNSKLTLSEQCHVAYQIKGNLECSNMVANICLQTAPTPPSRPWGWGQ